MIVWPEKELVIAVHDRQLAEHGGASGVRDDNLLQSALARPQQLYAYGEPPPDLCDLAASLAYGIARNHPFINGNKPTAWVVCRLVVKLNSATVTADAESKYLSILALAEGRISESDFAAWLRSNSSGVNTHDEVNQPAAGYA